MNNSITVSHHSKILVWWDGQAIAVVMGNTDQVIEQIERACREHSCYESVKLIPPVSINLGKRDTECVSVRINEGTYEYEGYVELTTITDYSVDDSVELAVGIVDDLFLDQLSSIARFDTLDDLDKELINSSVRALKDMREALIKNQSK